MNTKVLAQVKTKFHMRIGNILKIGRFLWSVEQNKQILIGAFVVIATGTGTIKQYVSIFGKKLPAQLLNLLKNVGMAHGFMLFCCKNKKKYPNPSYLSDFFITRYIFISKTSDEITRLYQPLP